MYIWKSNTDQLRVTIEALSRSERAGHLSPWEKEQIKQEKEALRAELKKLLKSFRSNGTK